jgi:hypothetical protein
LDSTKFAHYNVVVFVLLYLFSLNYILIILGLPQAIVLTKIDTVCSYVEEDITNVYQSETIQNLVDKVSNIFGVPRNLILPQKNYEKESEVDTHVSILALHTLKRLLLSANCHFFNLLDALNVRQQEVGGRHDN